MHLWVRHSLNKLKTACNSNVHAPNVTWKKLIVCVFADTQEELIVQKCEDLMMKVTSL